MSAHQGAGGADVPVVAGQVVDGSAPANGDRDSVDDVIERLLSVRGACSVFWRGRAIYIMEEHVNDV